LKTICLEAREALGTEGFTVEERQLLLLGDRKLRRQRPNTRKRNLSQKRMKKGHAKFQVVAVKTKR
jgi:hypothetical protein